MRLNLLSYFDVTNPKNWVNWGFGTQVSAQAIACASPLDLSSVEGRKLINPVAFVSLWPLSSRTRIEIHPT